MESEHEALRRKTRVQLAVSFHALADTLPDQPKRDLLQMVPYLTDDMTAVAGLLHQRKEDGELDPKLPTEDWLALAAQACRRLPLEEARYAAERTVEACQFVIQIIKHAEGTQSQVPALLSGLALGQAEVRMANVSSGLWALLLHSEYTDKLAQQAVRAKSAGGKATAAKRQANADEWKRLALETANQIDEPGWSRSKLAFEIKYKLDETAPDLKSIENWLKDEAEQPNGPIRSRARRK